ncbi:DUF6481 family protein [Ancylobacter defluvii]|uniref:Uncharacterized protein n=1 Tax=Ancylobacter defluvii TaxID=1282440 RepID=A0A9W6JW45_9HYPH|nr:DUF6481 family protein [Ancylobacter defluvii]MBS7589362.1 hypothetical protein [Ancylobacter defluvii]GLK84975.1 hypothetical protein GCM10017653_30450 [Ancylobacter defluvii]
MKINDTFEDRRRTAEASKARLLAKLKEMPKADDPAVIARNEARKAEKEARLAAKIARQEAAAAEKLANQIAAAERAAALEADAKAKRDARYAARKERAGK